MGSFISHCIDYFFYRYIASHFNFWISFKPISLSDLRPPKPLIKERLKGKLEIEGDKGEIHYRIRNSSRDQIINNVKLLDTIPRGLKVLNLDDRCQINQTKLSCNLGASKVDIERC